MASAFVQIAELEKQVAALTAQNAELKKKASTAQAASSTPNVSGPFTTRAQAEAAYCSLPDKTLADCRERAAFREKHKTLLGLGR